MKGIAFLAMCMVAAAIAIASSSARCESPAYIGLYFDQNRGACRLDVASAPQTISVWAFVRTTGDGIIAGGFNTAMPSWIHIDSYQMNPNALNVIGCPEINPSGAHWCITFASCQADEWVWLYRIDFLVQDANQHGSIAIIPYGSYPQFADCLYAPHSLVVFNNAHINEDCLISTRQPSWGAIKALFVE